MTANPQKPLIQALRDATDGELADYMAGFHSGSSEWIMCQQELARRQGAPAARRAWPAIGIALALLLLAALFILLGDG